MITIIPGRTKQARALSGLWPGLHFEKVNMAVKSPAAPN
jgi:hypothetical protein